MNKNLYCIPELAEALHGSDYAKSLHEALLRIERKGQERGFKVGYLQFHMLMDLTACFFAERQAATPPIDYDLIVDTLAGLSSDPVAALERLDRYPHWRVAFDEMRSQASGSGDFSPCIGLELRNEQGVLLHANMVRTPAVHRIENIVPGRYHLLLDTGTAIWERDLTRSHLGWSEAFPDAPLALAADTAGTIGGTCPPTLAEELFGGAIGIRVWPGLDAGRMELRLDAIGGGSVDEL